jgi:hypothetical protein
MRGRPPSSGWGGGNPRRGGGAWCFRPGWDCQGEGEWLSLDEGAYRSLSEMMGREIRPLTGHGPRCERTDGAGPRGRGAVHRRARSGPVRDALAVGVRVSRVPSVYPGQLESWCICFPMHKATKPVRSQKTLFLDCSRRRIVVPSFWQCSSLKCPRATCSIYEKIRTLVSTTSKDESYG